LIHALIFLLFAWQNIAPSAAQHMQAGMEAEQRRDIDAAITEYKQVTELEPKFAPGFVSLGQAYMEKREFNSALSVLKHAVELDPNFDPGHQLLGYAYLAMGYASEAIPQFEKVNEKAALGIAQMQLGKFAEAVTNLEAALAEHPNDPDLLYYLGRASGLLSKQSIDTLMATYPDSPRAHQAMGENYFVLRQMQEAEKEYMDALRQNPTSPEVHLELGEVYEGSSQWPKAEQEFRAETKLQPGNAEAAYRLGSVLLQEGKSKEAQAELIRADHLQPGMPETLYSLGKANALEGDPAGAEAAWIKLLSLEKDTPLAAQAHFALAGLYRKQKKIEAAQHEMQEFQKLQGNAGSVESSPSQAPAAPSPQQSQQR
jgi:tetratricopeptide (TPR) repeat protein